MTMSYDDKSWVKMNYPRIKDDEVFLDCMKEYHADALTLSLNIAFYGLLYLGLMAWVYFNQSGAWYLIMCAVPGLGLFVTGIIIFVSRVHYLVNPRLEVSKYLDEITDYDACKIRWHAEKPIPADESIEAVLACTDFYIDG